MTRQISVPILLVGVGAGLATALLFASLAGGSALALPLFFTAPLPLAIATLGWGTPAGAIGGLVAIAAIGLGESLPAALAVLLSDVAPTLVACHLLGLARPLDPEHPDSPPEWYPIGRVLLAVVITVALAALIGGFAAGFDPVETSDQMIAAYRQMLAMNGVAAGQMPSAAVLEPMVRAVVRAMPAVIPATWVLLVVFDIWIAAWVVRKSGRLARPREDLDQVELPVAAGVVFAASLAAAFLSGPIGLIAGVLAGALFSGHLLVGMGVLHALTRATGMRIIILCFCYGMVLLFTLPAALFALAGLAEPHVGLRRRLPPRATP